MALLAACMIGASYLVGVKTTTPPPENIAPAPAQSQADGSVILARDPAASASAPAHVIPKGAVVERQIKVTVQPKPRTLLAGKPGLKLTAPGAGQSSPDTSECGPVNVDLSLIRLDGGRRVIASSPDGTVIGGLDVPIESALLPTSHPWAAGVSVGQDKSPGVWIEHDMGRLRVGAEALRQTSGTLQARVRIGWSW